MSRQLEYTIRETFLIETFLSQILNVLDTNCPDHYFQLVLRYFSSLFSLDVCNPSSYLEKKISVI